MNSPAGLEHARPGAQSLGDPMQCTCEQDKPGPCHAAEAELFDAMTLDKAARLESAGWL